MIDFLLDYRIEEFPNGQCVVWRRRVFDGIFATLTDATNWVRDHVEDDHAKAGTSPVGPGYRIPLCDHA